MLYPLELKSPSENNETLAEKAAGPEIVSLREELPTDEDSEDVAVKGTDTLLSLGCSQTVSQLNKEMNGERRVCLNLTMND